MVRVNNVQQSIDTEKRERLFDTRRAFGHEDEYDRNRREWFEFPMEGIVADYPLHVDIELSSLCNLHCPMCYTITSEFKRRVGAGFIKDDLFEKIISECAEGKVFSIRLSLRGESLLHSNFVEYIEYAKRSGIKEVSTLTNGKKFLDRNFCKKIIEAGLDWITVSIDGIDSVYEGIRKPVKFEEIKKAMTNLMSCREEHNSKKPAIKIQGIWPAIKQNVDKYIDIFTPVSDLIYTNPLVDYLFNDGMDSIEYVTEFRCYQPFQRLVITSDGKALMCANDQLGEISIGSAHEMTIHELWHGEKMRQIREDHIQHRALQKYHPCQKCQVPRKREYEEAVVKGKKVYIENYTNRIQIIGK